MDDGHVLDARRVPVPGVVTGKPLSLGGSEGRTRPRPRRRLHDPEAARDLAWTSRGAVAVQGFGNVGSIAAHFIDHEGATVVAVEDSKGAICNIEGLNVAESSPGRREDGTVRGSRAPRSPTPNSSRPTATSSSPRRSRARSRCENAAPDQGPPGRRRRQRPHDAEVDDILQAKALLSPTSSATPEA